jgi:hypothetical protein
MKKRQVSMRGMHEFQVRHSPVEQLPTRYGNCPEPEKSCSGSGSKIGPPAVIIAMNRVHGICHAA